VQRFHEVWNFSHLDFAYPGINLENRSFPELAFESTPSRFIHKGCICTFIYKLLFKAKDHLIKRTQCGKSLSSRIRSIVSTAQCLATILHFAPDHPYIQTV
jgi:hypothetical protein